MASVKATRDAGIRKRESRLKGNVDEEWRSGNAISQTHNDNEPSASGEAADQHGRIVGPATTIR